MSAPHPLLRLADRLGDRASVYADRGAWLAARVEGIGASEVAPILGLSPHKGPWDVFEAKRRGERVEDEDTAPGEDDPSAAPDFDDHLVRGNTWEPWLRHLAGMYIGREVYSPGAPFGQPDGVAIVRHPLRPLRWAACSPDGWLVEDDGTAVPVELKTDAGRRGYGWGVSGTTIDRYVGDGDEPLAGLLGWPDVAHHYYLQCAWQMACLDAPHCYIVVLLGSFRVRWIRIQRDRDYERRVINAVAGWRVRHLVEGVEPDADGSEACIRHYTEKWKGQKNGEREATAEEAGLVEELGTRRVDAKAATDDADEAKGKLLPLMKDAAHLWLPGGKRGLRRDKRGAITTYGF